MTDSGPFGLSHFPRVHHRYRRRHSLRWWLLLSLIGVATAVWVVPGWR